MTYPTQPLNGVPVPEQTYSIKSVIIIVLIALLVVSFLGINMYANSEALFRIINDTIAPPIINLFGMLGYSTGELINETSNLSASIITETTDIADNAVESAGTLIKQISEPALNVNIGGDNPTTPIDGNETDNIPSVGNSPSFGTDTDMDILDSGSKYEDALARLNSLNVALSPPPSINYIEPMPDDATSFTQTPISKGSWCLDTISENGRRNCVSVDDSSKCISGEIFPNQSVCVNPALSQT